MQCHVTFGKRAASGLSNWIDRNAFTYSVLFGCCASVCWPRSVSARGKPFAYWLEIGAWAV